MRVLLLGRLKKLAAQAAPWRAKHDYFPRTLKLHNGAKVRFYGFQVFACHASARNFQNLIWILFGRPRALPIQQRKSENFETGTKVAEIS